MNPTDPAPGPVFVDDTGHRRRLVSTIVAMATVAALAASATLGWAVFANAPVSVADVTAVDHDTAGVIGRSAGRTSGRAVNTPGPFAVAVVDAPQSGPAAPCGVVRGTVFNDVDLNGSRQQESEKAIAGVVVELTDAAGVVSSTTSNSAGGYSFTVAAPGPVRLEFRGPLEEYIATPVGTDVAPWVSFPSGGPTCQVDTSVLWSGWFEERADPDTSVTREVGDRVWADLDGDGVQDPGEPGIGGVDLALLDAAGHQVAVTATSPAGTYRFSGLESGVPYRIVLARADPFGSGPLAGLEPTTPWAGTTFDGESLISTPGATGRDSGHRLDENGHVYLPVDPDERGASNHSIDIGFRAAS